jgi:ribonuclease P protein component
VGAISRAARLLQQRQASGMVSSIAMPSVRPPLSLSAVDRLHRSAEFIRLQRKGMRVQCPHFVLYAGPLPNDVERSRLGVTVSRRIGKAVIRNHVKRRVRECFRLVLRSAIPTGTSLVVIARGGAGELATPAIASELLAGIDTLAARFKVQRT